MSEFVNVNPRSLKPENTFKTLQGLEILVESGDDGVYINHDSKVTSKDKDATNGVVHIIDTVLVPHP